MDQNYSQNTLRTGEPMMGQDLISLCGSVFSLLVLVPTLRDSMANVQLGTSLPSATIGGVYGTTFFTMGMTMSAVGSLLTGVMWSAIAFLRSPLVRPPDRRRRPDDARHPRTPTSRPR